MQTICQALILLYQYAADPCFQKLLFSRQHLIALATVPLLPLTMAANVRMADEMPGVPIHLVVPCLLLYGAGKACHI